MKTFWIWLQLFGYALVGLLALALVILCALSLIASLSHAPYTIQWISVFLGGAFIVSLFALAIYKANRDV